MSTENLWKEHNGKGFHAQKADYAVRASNDEHGNPIDETYAQLSALPSNLPASKDGTDTSLVTTGNKYDWNDWKSVNISIPLPKDTIEVKGHLFKYVQIGNLLVTTENLDVPLGTVGTDCFWYGDDEDTNRELGMLYTWSALGTLEYKSGGYYTYKPTQEIVDCIHSQGWRVWTNRDFEYIRNQHSGSSTDTKHTNMCSTSGWLNSSQGTNELGLNLIPSGERHWDGKSYGYKGNSCVIRYTPFSDVQNSPQPEWIKPGYSSEYSGNVYTGASIRLVKDATA